MRRRKPPQSFAVPGGDAGALFTIHLDGAIMLPGFHRSPAMPLPATSRSADTEKLTINLGLVDLGQIDLLVQEGFYSNRSDFIRTAIRNHIATHAEAVKASVGRRAMQLGLVELTRADLEAVKRSGKRVDLQVLGLARIAADVPAALAQATIASVSVLGAFEASAAVKAALAGRIRR